MSTNKYTKNINNNKKTNTKTMRSSTVASKQSGSHAKATRDHSLPPPPNNFQQWLENLIFTRVKSRSVYYCTNTKENIGGKKENKRKKDTGKKKTRSQTSTERLINTKIHYIKNFLGLSIAISTYLHSP